MNKQGALTDVIIWMIIAFVTIMFFAVYIYGHNLATERLLDLQDRGIVNITGAARSTFQPVNSALQGLHTLAFVLIIALMLSIFISNFLIKAHPVFFAAHVLMTIIGVVFAVAISNAYENLMINTTIGPTVSDFTAASFIMLNLPLWVTVIGFVGAVFLFIGITRDTGAGGSII